jgi:hypothetical protein
VRLTKLPWERLVPGKYSKGEEGAAGRSCLESGDGPGAPAAEVVHVRQRRRID